ncbi:unnamed protein product [Amoebophrya sp. A120]|nr:unnamed protein product [Amoebophrya sp. A120]|eukprot:GSA120T00023333001.1
MDYYTTRTADQHDLWAPPEDAPYWRVSRDCTECSRTLACYEASPSFSSDGADNIARSHPLHERDRGRMHGDSFRPINFDQYKKLTVQTLLCEFKPPAGAKASSGSSSSSSSSFSGVVDPPAKQEAGRSGIKKTTPSSTIKPATAGPEEPTRGPPEEERPSRRNKLIIPEKRDFVEVGTSYYDTLAQCCYPEQMERDGSSNCYYLESCYQLKYSNCEKWLGLPTATGISIDAIPQNVEMLPRTSNNFTKIAKPVAGRAMDVAERARVDFLRKDHLRDKVLQFWDSKGWLVPWDICYNQAAQKNRVWEQDFTDPCFLDWLYRQENPTLADFLPHKKKNSCADENSTTTGGNGNSNSSSRVTRADSTTASTTAEGGSSTRQSVDNLIEDVEAVAAGRGGPQQPETEWGVEEGDDHDTQAKMNITTSGAKVEEPRDLHEGPASLLHDVPKEVAEQKVAEWREKDEAEKNSTPLPDNHVYLYGLLPEKMHEMRKAEETATPCAEHGVPNCKRCSFVGARTCATSSINEPTKYLLELLSYNNMLHLLKRQTVETEALSSILRRHKVLMVDTLKLDLEGADGEILRDLMWNHFQKFGLLSLPRLIIFEANATNWAEAQMMLQSLESWFGYKTQDFFYQGMRKCHPASAGQVSDMKVELPEEVERVKQKLWEEVIQVFHTLEEQEQRQMNRAKEQEKRKNFL